MTFHRACRDFTLILALFIKLRVRNLLFIVIPLLAFSVAGKGQHKLVKTKINEEISLKVPKTFMQMTEEDMWQRVSSYRKSIALFTDPQRIIDLGVNYSFSSFQEGDYEMMRSWYKASILQLFDDVEWEREEIVQIGKRQFVAFEFVSTITENSEGMGRPRSITKYQYLQYTVFNGNVLLVFFSAPDRAKEEWQPVARAIMESVRLK